MTMLLLKRASASRTSGEWNDDDYDLLADGVVVGRILKVHAAPVGAPWMWSLAFGHHKDRTPTHGYEAPREAGRGSEAEPTFLMFIVRQVSMRDKFSREPSVRFQKRLRRREWWLVS